METYEIRDPIHGFIIIDEWERDIINHPAFQRLRRIKQLALTNMIYPGAQHTRFEHSLGVMHLATRMFDKILSKDNEYLHEELNYNDSGLARAKKLIRLAALLHDVGHAPYSHPAEDLMPFKEDNVRYTHEDYSAGIINYILKDVIECENIKRNFGISAEDVSNLLSGKSAETGLNIVWRDLISSQLDADRADYLLRDSYFIGANYGIYDLQRIIETITIRYSNYKGGYTLGFERGGFHSAEAMIIARLMMFTQVYFHKTRRAYDIHITEALKEIYRKETQSDCFPPPVSKANLEKYLEWDDWKVNGLLHSEKDNEHAQRIIHRDHYRRYKETTEKATEQDIEDIYRLSKIFSDNDIYNVIDKSEKSWYKPHSEEIIIFNKKTGKEELLVDESSIVKELCNKTRIVRLYIKKEDLAKAKSLDMEV
jgi:hypothetical protein